MSVAVLLTLATSQLTPEDVKKALAGDLKGVEITLREHAGGGDEGNLLILRGDGSVTATHAPYYPMTAAEARVSETLRLPIPLEDLRKLMGGFSDAAVLGLPKVDSKVVDSRQLRHTLGLRIQDVGAFEAQLPHARWSKVVPSFEAKKLIDALLKAVDDQAKRVELADREFLSDDRLSALVKSDPVALTIELHDIQGLWGGLSLRLMGDGKVQGVHVRPPKAGESGMQVRRFQGQAEAVEVMRLAVESKVFDLKEARTHGVPDEVRPVLELRCTVEGAIYRRYVVFWDGEARETPAFQAVRTRLKAIGERLAK